MSDDKELTGDEILKALADAAEIVKNNHPAFAKMMERRKAAARPIITRTPPTSKGISFKLDGKAGEVKTVSAGASTADALLLFRGYHFFAKDTYADSGMGTEIVRIDIDGEDQLPSYSLTKRWTKYFAQTPLARGTVFDTLHPRSEVKVTVRFLHDCSWAAEMLGHVQEVKNEGVYAITPTVPCFKKMPDEVLDLAKVKPYDIDYGAASQRCNVCWFRLKQHPRWPWRKFEQTVEVALDRGDSKIVEVETAGPIYAYAFRADSNKYVEYRELRTDGFARGGEKFTATDATFDYSYRDGLFVPKGESLLIKVTNASGMKKRRQFTGKVVAHELVEV